MVRPGSALLVIVAQSLADAPPRQLPPLLAASGVRVLEHEKHVGDGGDSGRLHLRVCASNGFRIT